MQLARQHAAVGVVVEPAAPGLGVVCCARVDLQPVPVERFEEVQMRLGQRRGSTLLGNEVPPGRHRRPIHRLAAQRGRDTLAFAELRHGATPF